MKKINIISVLKKFKILLFIIFIIFQACSKDSIDDENENYNNDSNYNLLWQSGTSYDTTIQVGETITWTWGGGTHNLRSTGGVENFDSGFFTGPGPQFSYTFNAPGVTTYICDPHPNSMFGTVTVTSTASVGELNMFEFNIYPIPASNMINISFDNISNDQIIIEVYDLLGRLNQSIISNVVNGKTSLDISELSRGIYIAKITSGSTVSVKRFIKE